MTIIFLREIKHKRREFSAVNFRKIRSQGSNRAE